ncbi:hypothetical protein Y032_0181g838 [Ancylostoma ceylanicum]|uniref:Uncharacterized protein n=1 Tax=Ancylostoma ceylanicum TaxID=53326 RepID=A0A016ST29_9BILA|nr:hypothetical protein Y032_0181g838 [Ancylostoma ceylanicum]
MVWGRISGLGKTTLVFVQQGIEIDAELHLKQILKDALIPCAESNARDIEWACYREWAPAHGAKKALKCCGTNLLFCF